MTALNRPGGRVSPWTGESLETAQARATREHTASGGCRICPPTTTKETS